MSWYCNTDGLRIGIGIGIGIVYVLSEKVVLVLELFTQALKNWYFLVLELELFIPYLKNWYWHWNCLYYECRIRMNWYWNWNCFNNYWRIGIGTGIVYTMAEELVLVLELFTQSLKNWYWSWYCLHSVWRIGIGLDFVYLFFLMRVGELVLVLDNMWWKFISTFKYYSHNAMITVP